MSNEQVIHLTMDVQQLRDFIKMLPDLGKAAARMYVSTIHEDLDQVIDDAASPAGWDGLSQQWMADKKELSTLSNLPTADASHKAKFLGQFKKMITENLVHVGMGTDFETFASIWLEDLPTYKTLIQGTPETFDYGTHNLYHSLVRIKGELLEHADFAEAVLAAINVIQEAAENI